MNKELKKKYNAIVVGYKHDSERIPEIDVLLEDNEICCLCGDKLITTVAGASTTPSVVSILALIHV
mgnify:CR=1 FL=1